MDKLTRGNLLATLKSLKKHKRPKFVAANASVAVQAICPQKVKVNKAADIKAVLERRKALVGRNKSVSPMVDVEMFMQQYNAEMEEFCAMLKAKCSNNKVSSK